jgi:hypothetical protein
MGNINIGRQGWSGIALETTPGVGVSPTDYVQFMTNTLFGDVKNDPISNATQNRIKNFSSVPTQKMGKGDIEMYADPKIMGYFLVGALGSVVTTNPSGSIYNHTITVKNTNSTPQTLTIINDRQGSVDQEAYYSAVVDQFTLSLADGLATAKAALITNFPQTTTSGTATTASGTVYAYPGASFAFGSTVAAADSAANLKTHDFTITIKNNAKPIFRHGANTPDTINVGDFEMDTSFKLYFENNTDLQNYYNSKKQAAQFKLTGGPVGSGLSEFTKFRWYQTRIDSFQLETGLSNFYIEDVKLVPEYDNANSIAMDVVIQNNKTLYI